MWPVSSTEPRRPLGGFTLVEVLVALAIFALTTMIAYAGLNRVVSTKAALEREMDFWGDLGLVFDRIEADFLQSLPQPLDDGGGHLGPPLRGGRLMGYGEAADGFFIELMRQDAERGAVRVRYHCAGPTFALQVSPVHHLPNTSADRAGEPINTVLLGGVEHCQVAFLNAANHWQDSWPGDQALARPRGVRLRLTLVGQGNFERIFALP